MRYPWGHFVYGGFNQAWCNVCDTEITSWQQSWMGSDSKGLPAATRKRITAHVEGCAS